MTPIQYCTRNLSQCSKREVKGIQIRINKIILAGDMILYIEIRNNLFNIILELIRNTESGDSRLICKNQYCFYILIMNRWKWKLNSTT